MSSSHRPSQVAPVAAVLAEALGHYQAGRLVEADALLRKAIARFPRSADAHHLAGLVAQASRRLAEAQTLLEKAIALDPGKPDFHANLAVTMIGQGDLHRAEQHARDALVLNSRHFAALVNLGLVLTEKGQLTEAISHFERALAERPQVAAVHGNLGKAARLLGDYGKSLSAYDAAHRLAPTIADHALGRAMALYMLGRTAESRDALEAAAQRWPGHLEILSARTFVLNYFADVSADRQAQAARDYGAALAQRVRPATHRPDPGQADRPIRVGLVSGDLREHSVSLFLLAVLPHLARDRITLVAYATSRRSDDRTALIRAQVDEWVDASVLPPAALAAKITADRIDVLLDLSGHTQGNRLPVLAARPAPVSASWLGYSGTTGVGAIDYLVADAIVAPPGDDAHLVERPWRLPNGFLCFPAASETPRMRVGTGMVFGSFNSHNKLGPETLQTWARILGAVEDSRLLLKSRALAEPAERQATEQRFADLGIDPGRLTLLGRTPTQEAHLALYGEMDIALDPFPYNGTTTTMQALRMGVPVLTLAGDRYVSRVGQSLLTHAGLADWVARDIDHYVALAAQWATNRDGLAMLRKTLPQRIAAAPIADPARFGADFSAMLRGMWRTWCLSGTTQ